MLLPNYANAQNLNSNAASNGNSNNNYSNNNSNYYYYAYSKQQQLQPLNSHSQTNLLYHHTNLHLNTHLGGGVGGSTGAPLNSSSSYLLNYANGAATPTFGQPPKSLAASSAALIANKSKLRHRMSASSVLPSTNNATTTPTPSITPLATNTNTNYTNTNINSLNNSNSQASLLSNSHESYNMMSNNNQEQLSSKSSAASLTLYTYLLQTNKNIGKDIKASVIRSQTKKLGRTSPGTV